MGHEGTQKIEAICSESYLKKTLYINTSCVQKPSFLKANFGNCGYQINQSELSKS